MAVLNCHRIAKFYLTFITTQLHAMIIDIESMGKPAICILLATMGDSNQPAKIVFSSGQGKGRVENDARNGHRGVDVMLSNSLQ